jgi:hypothetical protein
MVSQQSELTKFNEREMPHLPSTFRLDRLVRHLIRHSSTRYQYYIPFRGVLPKYGKERWLGGGGKVDTSVIEFDQKAATRTIIHGFLE